MAPAHPGVAADVVTIGESMAFMVPDGGAGVAVGTRLTLGVGGAESNVAMVLARSGVASAWVSAVGADAFGTLIVDEVAAAGVDVSGVLVDDANPTGAYVKLQRDGRSAPLYFRRGSAASRLGPESLGVIRSARIAHVSGITLALSDSTAQLVHAVLAQRDTWGAVSFDVNHRAALWAGRSASEALLDAARAADVVFVGRDEAEALWGTATAAEIRELLRDVPTLVVKDADVGATAFDSDGVHFVPAPVVDVVEPVGAGDAFAAGWLRGRLDGSDPRMCLALGHILAGHALTQWGDVPQLPAPATVRGAAEALLARLG